MSRRKSRRPAPTGTDAPAPSTPPAAAPLPPAGPGAEKRFKYPFEKEDAEPKPLTPREEQIVALVAEGSTNVIIAERLVTSDRNVEKHMKNVRRKLKLKTRTAVAAWWLGRRIAKLELRIRELGGSADG